MYAVGDSLPVEQLDPGSLLLAGPAMAGKYELLLSLAVEGFAAGDAAVVVTTNHGSETIFEDIEERVGSVPEGLRLVDTVVERGGVSDQFPADRVEYVNSPADLTGIGIGVSEQLRRMAETDVDRIRFGFYSLSTLLMYAELETVFRFLHVLTGRVGNIDGLGFFVVDPTTHDEGTINTLKQLFDGMIELREEGGERQVRMQGIQGAPAEWQPRP